MVKRFLQIYRAYGAKTSLCRSFIVDGGFGTFPIFSESFQARAQISSLRFINAAIMQCHRRISVRDFHQFPAHGLKFRRRQLGQFIDNLGYTYVFNLVCTGKIATANWQCPNPELRNRKRVALRKGLWAFGRPMWRRGAR